METFKYIAVYQKIVCDIHDGYLVYHQKIPSIRQMSKEMQVSKTTVENAYLQLLAEGYIYAVEKKGYFVDVQETLQTSIKKEEAHIPSKEQVYLYDFSGRKVNTSCFDIQIWQKYIKRTLHNQDALLSYGSPFGQIELLEQLQLYSYQYRGVKRPTDQMIVGAGFQVLLQQLCHCFLRPISIGMDEVGFIQAQSVFENLGIEIIKIPSDKDGIDMKSLADFNIQMLYIHSSSSGYHGKPLKRQRRIELLKYAREKEVYLIEDDHNGELKFLSKPIDALAKDDDQWVIYIGSFSKVLLPSIRISYMSLPKQLMNKFIDKNKYYHQTTSKLEQLAFAAYLEDNQLGRHIKRLRKYYAALSTHLIDTWQTNFPQYPCILYETPLKITIDLPTKLVDTYIELAKKESIYILKNNHHQVALSFSSIDYEDVDKAIKILKRIWK